MAEVCRMRLYDAKKDFGVFFFEGIDIPEALLQRDLKLLHIAGTGPAKAAGEFSAPTAQLGLVGTTAVAMETVSSSADDGYINTDHGRSVMTIGIDADDNIVEREEIGHATDWSTADHAATHTYKEVFHMYGCLWGVDEDFAGQLDIRTVADAVQVSIAVGANESNGSRFCIPDNHAGCFVKARVQALDDTWTADKGGQIIVYAYDVIDGASGHVQADCALNNYTIDLYSGVDGTRTIVDKPMVFYTEKTYIKTFFDQLNTGTDDLRFDFYFLIWKVRD